MSTSNPALKHIQQKYSENPWENPQQVATVDGLITKTSLSLGMVMLVAAGGYLFLPLHLLMPLTIGASLASLVAAFVVALRPQVKGWHLGVYALLQGIFLGGLSRFFELLYPGLVTQAVVATFVVAGLTLFVYRSSGLRVTSKMRRMAFIATGALAIVYLVNLGLSLAGISTGIIEIGGGAGPLAIVVSLIAVGLATFNLVIDFDDARTLVEERLPAQEEWRVAFALTVTLVWLYVELLRILSYFRR